MDRHIPATMATQHPDNACAPYWEKDGDGYISAREEVDECYSAYADLGCEEFMWDWEGKYVDEAIVDRLFQTYFDFFKKKQLGRDIFLTFRIPNIWQEAGHNISRALMGILTAEQYAQDLRLHTPPLFEVILPMTTKAEYIIEIQKKFQKMSKLQRKLFINKPKLKYLRVWPLIENVDDLVNCRKILEDYLELHKKYFRAKPNYLRVHIARSDPALNSGYVAAVLAAKHAISDCYEFSRDAKIPVFPAIGVGGLLFRGGLMPARVKEFVEEFPGARTAYIQSAFRYDVPKDKAKKALDFLNKNLPESKPVIYKPTEKRAIKKMCRIFSRPYKKTVESIAVLISEMAEQVPKRRERKLHVGLFGYSRRIGRKRLPRAIGFTAVMYSLGAPPEFIGLGRGLREAQKAGLDVCRYMPGLKNDLQSIGRFVNYENLRLLSKHNKAWKDIIEDIELAENILGIKCAPATHEDFIYRNLSSNFYHLWQAKKPVSDCIAELGIIRKSLG